jgi:cell wall-associated NlpC family hydrolase
MTGDLIVAAARSMLGVRWRHLGRSRDGIDCIGLVLHAAREAGIDLPDPAPYERQPQGTRLTDAALHHAMRVARPEPGDVLVFRMGLYGGHLGIAAVHPSWRVPSCIHAYAPHKQVVEQPIDGELRAAMIGAYRLRGA